MMTIDLGLWKISKCKYCSKKTRSKVCY